MIPSTGVALDPKKKISQYIHDHWGIEDGLPQSKVSAIIQTSDGYLWLGTEEGLVRFDGVRFQVYDKRNLELYSHTDIFNLFEDREGRIWITGNGKGLISFKEGKFTAYTTKDGLSGNYVYVIYEDRKGTLWIGTEFGLNRLKDGKLASYTTKDGLSNDIISAIYEDRQGNLWIGTENGLNCLKDGKFAPYTTNNGFSNKPVRVIYEDQEGNLWIGTLGGGLHKLEDGKFTSYTIKNGFSSNWIYCIYEDWEGGLWIGTDCGLNRLKDGKFNTYTTKNGLSHDHIWSIYEDREGTLWIVTMGGLNRLKDGEFNTYTAKDGLPNNSIWSIYEDREGSLWIGAWGEGLNRLRDSKFTTYTTRDGLSNDIVYPICGDRKGNMWIGTWGGGLNCYKDGKFTSYTTKDGLSDDNIISIYEDGDGSLWIGTSAGGLNCFKDGKFTTYTTKNGLSNNYITSIREDREGCLWIGTWGGGLDCLKNEKFTSYTSNDGLSCDKVFIIYEDRDGRLWIGTQYGLSCLKDCKFTSYTTRDGLSNDKIFAIYEDAEGSLWIGTKGGGLNRLKDGKFKSITSREGLFDDKIFQVLEDDFENLWMGCNRGIFLVSKQELNNFFSGEQNNVTCVSFNETDGMKSRECNGEGRPAGWKSQDGKLWFPTIKGVVIIDPTNIESNRLPPPVKIEEIIIDNKEIQPSFNSNGEKLVLSPGKERFEIHYTGLSFQVPERVRFKCKLEGFDEEWQDVGTRRIAYYTKLPPGDYTFRVTACNNDGVWNETGASVSFYLEPFFYQATWFHLLCALVVGLIGITGYRLRVRQLKAREKSLSKLVDLRTRELKERNVELEKAQQSILHSKELIEAKNRQLQEQSEKLKEMDKVKSRFFANISHEFRTPLTLIMGPLEQMISACPVRAEEKKRKLTLMLRNAQRLLRLINQLLELSKLDSGKMKLKAGKTNIISFLKGIIDSFRFMAHQKEMELIFHPGTDIEDVNIYIDPRKMEDVISNLLVNAFKFTPPGGEIRVTIKRNSAVDANFPVGFVEILVCDTGPGIPGEQLSHIFDRFYQADATYEYHEKGSGIGLALSRELVELHHGTIEAQSREGEGSAFIIKIPMGSGHLAPDEIVEKECSADVIPDAYFDMTGVSTDVKADTTPMGKSLEPMKLGTDIILVVEDSADMREYIKGALEPGYTVVDAKDGREGVQKAQEIIPDLIISDIMMPGVDGYELCKTLKENVKTSHIPIILLTAKASEDNVLQGLENGANDYITKPFNTKILMARIKNLIAIRSQLQKNINREITSQRVKTSVAKIDREFLHDLHHVINKNLSDEEFNVEQLCKRLYMSRTTLYRKVHALTGQTPTDFIRSYRLKRGAELLKQKTGTVLEVAFEVGFGNSSYFAKCFKEKFHQLPSTYQASEGE
ncbi:MAG: two-component regulator propeller domain-containing protein [Candidatus Aminicenantes bacterium]